MLRWWHKQLHIPNLPTIPLAKVDAAGGVTGDRYALKESQEYPELFAETIAEEYVDFILSLWTNDERAQLV